MRILAAASRRLCSVPGIKSDVVVGPCVAPPARNSASSARTLNCLNPNLPLAFSAKTQKAQLCLRTARGARGSLHQSFQRARRGPPAPSQSISDYR